MFDFSRKAAPTLQKSKINNLQSKRQARGPVLPDITLVGVVMIMGG
jgi:hypothetical protein